MSVNYFNVGEESSGMSNDIMEEIEYRVVSNKISKLTNPVGGKILESTESGDISEGHFGIEDITQMVLHEKNESKQNYNELQENKISKFHNNVGEGKLVVSNNNRGIKTIDIDADSLQTRIRVNEISAGALETRIQNNETAVGALNTKMEANKTAVATLQTSVNAVERKDFSSYISVTAELFGALDSGDIFSYGSGAGGNLRGGYVVMKDGVITKGSLSCVGSSEYTSVPAKVTVCVNGVPSAQKMEMSRTRNYFIKIFDPPIPVKIGDRLFFIADRPVSDAEWTVTSLLIRSSPGTL